MPADGAVGGLGLDSDLVWMKDEYSDNDMLWNRNAHRDKQTLQSYY